MHDDDWDTEIYDAPPSPVEDLLILIALFIAVIILFTLAPQ